MRAIAQLPCTRRTWLLLKVYLGAKRLSISLRDFDSASAQIDRKHPQRPLIPAHLEQTGSVGCAHGRHNDGIRRYRYDSLLAIDHIKRQRRPDDFEGFVMYHDSHRRLVVLVIPLSFSCENLMQIVVRQVKDGFLLNDFRAKS
jgi:hypothetical protein